MAKIDTRIDDTTLILTVVGDLTAEEVIYAIKNIYPASNSKYIIWDLTNASLSQMSRSDFEAIARTAKESVASGLRQPGKTTHVVTSTAEYGLFRMYTSIAEMTGVPVEYSVFRTFEEARQWIAQDTES